MYAQNWNFPGDSVVKNHLPVRETWVWFLDQEDPLQKEMATHSSIFAWEIPWREETVHEVAKESDMTQQLSNSNSQN